MRYEIRLSGTGGQGSILASIILAEACGVYDGKKVVQTQSYGPEARGGASRADVIVADEEILYPKARRLDLLACMSQQACDCYTPDLKEDGIQLVDSFYVRQCYRDNIFSLPLSQSSRQNFNRELFTNIILLGSIVSISGIVKLESLKKAVKNRVPTYTLEINLRALELGAQLGAKAMKESGLKPFV
ncbi:MAG: 2-oxoacid:acceptor oxidoreductase family protein [candidate division WOR-3 bacterium]|nr:2-oxoacid:acceptor oxidoreductase family protein [candidate division WOR-3 bacterium]